MGFFSGLFSSKQTVKKVRQEYVPVISADGSTGVDRYINTQGERPAGQSGHSKKLSGVDKYLHERQATVRELSDEEKELINARIAEKQQLTEECLMNAENEKLSGVARYVESQENARKAAQEKEMPKTGVAKYIANVIANKPVQTGVARYLFNRVEKNVSSVDRYVINKALADKSKPKVVVLEPSSVTKYLQNKPTMLTSSVAKYIAKQAVAAKQASA